MSLISIGEWVVGIFVGIYMLVNLFLLFKRGRAFNTGMPGAGVAKLPVESMAAGG